VLLGWVHVYYYRKDFKGLIDLVERYRSRVEALGDTRRQSLLLFWLGFSHFIGARFDTANSFLEKALALGEGLDDGVTPSRREDSRGPGVTGSGEDITRRIVPGQGMFNEIPCFHTKYYLI